MTYNEPMNSYEEDVEKPTWEKPCENCHETITRWRGDGDITCDHCGALYNTFGQRLRDDAQGNPSMYDDDIDDLEGYELQHAYDD